jgi:hypothetical protein
MTFKTWRRTLQANRFAVSWRCRRRVIRLTLRSLVNSWHAAREDRACDGRIDGLDVSAPLFVLGHWRSGTTFVQNLLACDRQFAPATWYAALNPHTFLVTGGRRAGSMRRFASRLPSTRGIDKTPMGPHLPGEDEFALAAATGCSPYLMWSFPRNGRHYERYLTFSGVRETELSRWKTAFVRFAKKLVYPCGLRPLLKSPPHTARVRLLLSLFPDARFLHVHRNPYEVFHSTRRLHDAMTSAGQLQRSDNTERDATILRLYRAMHEAYFDQRPLIREGRLHEVALADLARDPVGQMRIAYAALGLTAFKRVWETMEAHAAAAERPRQPYPELPRELETRVRAAGAQAFDAWGYPRAQPLDQAGQ